MMTQIKLSDVAQVVALEKDRILRDCGILVTQDAEPEPGDKLLFEIGGPLSFTATARFIGTVDGVNWTLTDACRFMNELAEEDGDG